MGDRGVSERKAASMCVCVCVREKDRQEEKGRGEGMKRGERIASRSRAYLQQMAWCEKSGTRVRKCFAI